MVLIACGQGGTSAPGNAFVRRDECFRVFVRHTCWVKASKDRKRSDLSFRTESERGPVPCTKNDSETRVWTRFLQTMSSTEKVDRKFQI